MFGHHKKDGSEAEQELAVDAILEVDVGVVEDAVDTHFGNPNELSRHALAPEGDH